MSRTQPFKIADLREPGVVFAWGGYPYTFSAVGLGPTKMRDKAGAVYAMVELLVRPADLPGVYHRRNMNRDFEIHLPVMVSHPNPSMHVWGVPDDLGDVGLWRRGMSFSYVDPGHYAVCPRCESLYPCSPHNDARVAHRRQLEDRHLAAHPLCSKCGKGTHGGMVVFFGDPPDRVAFHGKRGACENAAYRYAAEHGWVLPPKDQDRAGRSWTIWGGRHE